MVMVLLLHHRPFSCLRRTAGGMVFIRMCGKEESRGKETNSGSPGTMAVKLAYLSLQIYHYGVTV